VRVTLSWPSERDRPLYAVTYGSASGAQINPLTSAASTRRRARRWTRASPRMSTSCGPFRPTARSQALYLPPGRAFYGLLRRWPDPLNWDGSEPHTVYAYPWQCRPQLVQYPLPGMTPRPCTPP